MVSTLLSQPLPVIRWSVPKTAVDWAHELQTNHMLSRTTIELLGDGAVPVIIARTLTEKLEKVADRVFWVVKSLGLPPLFDTFYKRPYEQRLAQQYGLPSVGSKGLLSIPLEQLDVKHWNDQLSRWLQDEVKQTPEALERLEELGLKSVKQLTPALRQDVLNGKLGIMKGVFAFFGFGTMAFFWARNAISAKIQGNAGYSGIQNYANKAYLAKQEKTYKKNKKKNMALNFAVSTLTMFSLPMSLRAVINSTSHSPWMKRLKAGVHHFNFKNGLHMSKLGLAYTAILGWTIPRLLAARDSNERREDLVKDGTFLGFMIFGDDIFGSLVAKVVSGAKHHVLETPIVEPLNKSLSWVPKAVSLDRIIKTAGKDSVAAKLAAHSYIGGILVTSLLYGLTLPLLNYWYTHKKVEAEQQTLVEETPQANAIASQPARNIIEPVFEEQTQPNIAWSQTESAHPCASVPALSDSFLRPKAVLSLPIANQAYFNRRFAPQFTLLSQSSGAA